MSEHDLPESAENLDAFWADVEAKISQFGHAIVTTSVDLPNGEALGFSHTLGLGRKGLPELAVFALQPDVAVDLLNAIAEKIQDGSIGTDRKESGLASGFDLVLKQADRDLAMDFASAWSERGDQVGQVWQVIWADKNGNLPWTGEFEASLRPLQPLMMRIC